MQLWLCVLPAAGLKRSEAELAALGSRLGRLEGMEASNPRASLRLVSALEDKMESMAAAQVHPRCSAVWAGDLCSRC